jgi:AcrR family transcriptional regulator
VVKSLQEQGSKSELWMRSAKTKNMPTKNANRVNQAWGKRPPPSRGPKPALSTSEIARVAIELADAEGLDAITMQGVARKVGVTTMALYRYFPGKADLLDLMIDSASDSAPNFGKPTLPWSTRLKGWARRCLAIYQNHPWFLEATSVRRSIMGPNELLWMEAALAMLSESGLASADRHSAFLALIGQVRGHATFQEIKKYGESAEEWTYDLAHVLESEAGRYPALMKALDSGAFSKKPARAFEFAVDCILDGIRARCTESRYPVSASQRDILGDR